MDQAELEKQRRYFWDSALTVMNGPKTLLFTDRSGGAFYSSVKDVEADPYDKLILKFPNGEQQTYQMYSTAWKRSLDYLLFRYLTLVLHNSKASSMIKVPVDVRSKYQAYDDLSEKRKQPKKDSFILPDYYDEIQEGKRYSDDSNGLYEGFETNSPVAPAILNVFCHGLYPHASKKTVRRDPYENAKLYTLEGYGNDTIPDFNPEDYIAYELMTGISLSAEITAVLMELDQEIRDLAFDYFCDNHIQDVVSLPFPYARASAVRNYFLQISIDWNKARYHWGYIPSKDNTKEIVEIAANDAYGYIDALYQSTFHPEAPAGYYPSDNNCTQEDLDYLEQCKTDRTLPIYCIRRSDAEPGHHDLEYRYFGPQYRIAFPNTDDINEIEAYKEQIKANLRIVSSPGDCVKILDPKPKCLAVFTNPNHKYIPQLKQYMETGEMIWKGSNNLPLKSDKAKALFQCVFHSVREASIKAYRDISLVNKFFPKGSYNK